MRKICLDHLQQRALETENLDAYYERKNGVFQAQSWGKYFSMVKQFASGLIALGHQEGEAVCVLGFNRSEWLISALAAQMAKGISAGIYSSCSCEEVAHVINHSECSILIVENYERYVSQVEPLIHSMPKLRYVIFMNDASIPNQPNLLGFNKVLTAGKDFEVERDRRFRSINEEDTATLIYTSGTTGAAKGVMLSHKAIHFTVKTACEALSMGPNDCNLSYLPLARVAEQMFSIYAPLMSGMSTYFADSMEKLPENLKEVQPTLFFGVPRVYEKIYERIRDRMSQVTGFKKHLVNWAQKNARVWWNHEHAKHKVSLWVLIQYRLAQKIVFNKFKNQIGFGRARVCVSGAAPISADILEFFSSLDLPIYEVYGQSEDCGPTSLNVPGGTKIGSVGRAFPGVTVKIAEDGEILVKGPNLFSGYFKDEKATRETLIDGWLHSGDVGVFDQDGFLKITDRKKDLLITAGGKNISPQNIESMLKQIPMVSHAVVVGDGKKYLAALLTLTRDQVLIKAKTLGVELDSYEKIIEHTTLKQFIQGEIDKINNRMAPVEQIKKFTLLRGEFSIQDGELTPTMKIKRKVINEKYKREIAELYV